MRFYVGTYTRLGGPGIAVCDFTDEGISCVEAVHDLEDPIYVILSNDAGTLFAVGCDAAGEGMAASYRAENGYLTLLSKQYTGGHAACHLALSPDERFLYVANYLSGSVSVFPVCDGRLDECIQLLEHHGSGPNKERQEAAHTHQCVFRTCTDELFVCDLGMDKIVVYRQDWQSGKLSLTQEITMPSGMGPRHLVFSDANSFYVTGELDNHVRRCVNAGNEWIIDGEICTLPSGYQGESLTAAIRLYQGMLYVSNRGHDSLCRISLDEAGNMLDAVCTPTGGMFPRDFAPTEKGMLFAHQDGGGIIAENGACLPMNGTVCICVDHTTVKKGRYL